MSTIVKRGFAIGFALAAILGGLWAWREGLIGPSAERRVEAPAEPGSAPKPPAPAAPSPEAKPGAEPAPPPAPKAAEAAPEPKPAPAPADAAPPSGLAGDTLQSDPKTADKPAFDVVRVEPSGESVVAGRCVAGCTAELTANGKTIGTAKADATGAFAMTPPTLPPGDHQLGLTVTAPDGKKETSEQTVTVSVPKAPSKEVVVVLNAPDAPSKILQRPGAAPAAAGPDEGGRTAARDAGPAKPAAVAGVSLGAIDAENGRFFVQGEAPAGARLRIYLNNAPIAEAVAGADGRWSLRVERGLAPGRYAARVDHLDADGKVVKRAEASFDYEPEVAAAAPAQPKPAPAGPAAGAASQDRQKEKAAPGAAGPSAAQKSEPQRQAAGDPASGRAGSGPAAAEPPAPSGAPSGSSSSGAAPSSGAPAASPAPDAQAAAPSRDASRPAAADPANPVVAAIDTAKVKRGDTLWRISRTTYGQGRRYTVIFTANGDQIRNPNLIYPGQVLVLPNQATDAAENPPR